MDDCAASVPCRGSLIMPLRSVDHDPLTTHFLMVLGSAVTSDAAANGFRLTPGSVKEILIFGKLAKRRELAVANLIEMNRTIVKPLP